jgi:SanA protein
MKVKFQRNKVFKLFGLSLTMLLLGAILIFWANSAISANAKGKIYESVEDIPYNKVGLVLGTAKVLRNGRLNLYFKYRIEATAKLYKAGKIDFVLVSGDNGNKGYDEPSDFKNALIEKGIPASKIFLDYAGFRTLDSVVRSKKVFGVDNVTFISQQFHNERAIYLAEHFDIKAIAFSAQDVSRKYSVKVRIREYFARVKVFVDFMLGTDPKFLGEPIKIE